MNKPETYKIRNKKNYKKLMRLTGQAIEQYNLIEEGDRIMVAVSGGKDSFSLLHVLIDLQKKSLINFSLFAYNLDQGQPDFQTQKIKNYVEQLNIEHYFVKEDTFSVTKEKVQANESYCSLCARFRRGILYREANRLKANKIALGHHCDDAIETLLMNLFYSGRMAAMAPILQSDDKKNIVIRPFIFVEEKMLSDFSQYMNFPVTDCGSCKTHSNKERARLKQWIQEETQRNSVVRFSLRRAMSNVQPRHLWDNRFFDFENFRLYKPSDTQE